MSRLEEKLIELGYRKISYYNFIRYKKETKCHCIIFEVSKQREVKIQDNYILSNYFYKQQEIDNLQQAFNEMQKDLEVLRNVESKK